MDDPTLEDIERTNTLESTSTNPATEPALPESGNVWKYALPGILLTIGLIWSYWPSLSEAAGRWAGDPQYSHGYLVPLFGLFLLWHRRAVLRGTEIQPWPIVGLALLGFALGLRWFGTQFFYNGLDLLSLVPAALAIFIIIGGRAMMNWAWPTALFLIFMVPLPFRLQTALSSQLQRIATDMSTYALQTAGVPAVSEGNVIVLDNVRIGVVQACSGLGMMMTFAAIATAVVLLVNTKLWIKAILLASALPVAILSNVVRITITGFFYHADQGELAQAVFHDFAGWLMMPLAVGLLLLEMVILERIVIEQSGEKA